MCVLVIMLTGCGLIEAAKPVPTSSIDYNEVMRGYQARVAKDSEIQSMVKEIQEATPDPNSVIWLSPDPALLSNSKQYVLNNSTKVFHLPTCRFVKQIDSANKEEIVAAREDLIASDFKPCGVCHP